MMLDLKFDTRAIDAALDTLAAKVSRDTIHAGSRAAAQVFYEDALARVPVDSGKLKGAVYHVYSKSKSRPGHSVFHVSWNYKKAPHGHLVEFGTSNAPAHPFLRPAYESKKAEAVDAAQREMAEALR